MAKYAAVCNRFPELQIGTEIKFSEGSFETDDEELWEQLKKNDWWGVFIHPRDGEPPAETPAEPAPEPPTDAPAEGEEAQAEEHEESHGYRVRRGSRGSR